MPRSCTRQVFYPWNRQSSACIYNWVIFQECICKLSCLELRKHFPTEVILEKRVPFPCQNTKPDLEHSVSEIAIQIDYGDIHGKCDQDPPNLELGILGTQWLWVRQACDSIIGWFSSLPQPPCPSPQFSGYWSHDRKTWDSITPFLPSPVQSGAVPDLRAPQSGRDNQQCLYPYLWYPLTWILEILHNQYNSNVTATATAFPSMPRIMFWNKSHKQNCCSKM